MAERFSRHGQSEAGYHSYPHDYVPGRGVSDRHRKVTAESHRESIRPLMGSGYSQTSTPLTGGETTRLHGYNRDRGSAEGTMQPAGSVPRKNDPSRPSKGGSAPDGSLKRKLSEDSNPTKRSRVEPSSMYDRICALSQYLKKLEEPAHQDFKSFLQSSVVESKLDLKLCFSNDEIYNPLTSDIQTEVHLFLNEMFISRASGANKKDVKNEACKSAYLLLTTKSVSELLSAKGQGVDSSSLPVQGQCEKSNQLISKASSVSGEETLRLDHPSVPSSKQLAYEPAKPRIVQDLFPLGLEQRGSTLNQLVYRHVQRLQGQGHVLLPNAPFNQGLYGSNKMLHTFPQPSQRFRDSFSPQTEPRFGDTLQGIYQGSSVLSQESIMVDLNSLDLHPAEKLRLGVERVIALVARELGERRLTDPLHLSKLVHESNTGLQIIYSVQPSTIYHTELHGNVYLGRIHIGSATSQYSAWIKKAAFRDAINTLLTKDVDTLIQQVKKLTISKKLNKPGKSAKDEESPIPAKPNVDLDDITAKFKNLIYRLSKSKYDPSSVVKLLDGYVIQSFLAPVSYYSKVGLGEDNTERFCCELYIDDVQISAGEGSVLKSAQMIAYIEAWERFSTVSVEEILQSSPRMTEQMKHDQKYVEIFQKGQKEFTWTNSMLLESIHPEGPNLARPLSDLVILETEKWASQGAFCVLNNSAAQCGLLMEWLFQKDKHNSSRCHIYIQKQHLGNAKNMIRYKAREQVAMSALKNLYEDHDVIQQRSEPDSENWYSWDRLQIDALSDDEVLDTGAMTDQDYDLITYTKEAVYACHVVQDFFTEDSNQLEECVFDPCMPQAEQHFIKTYATNMLGLDTKQKTHTDGCVYLVVSKGLPLPDISRILKQTESKSLGRYCLLNGDGVAPGTYASLVIDNKPHIQVDEQTEAPAAQTEVQDQPQTQIQGQTNTDAQSKTQTQTLRQTQTPGQTNTDAQSKTQTRTSAQRQAQRHTQTHTQAKAQAQVLSQTQAQTKTRPQGKTSKVTVTALEVKKTICPVTVQDNNVTTTIPGGHKQPPDLRQQLLESQPTEQISERLKALTKGIVWFTNLHELKQMYGVFEERDLKRPLSELVLMEYEASSHQLHSMAFLNIRTSASKCGILVDWSVEKKGQCYNCCVYMQKNLISKGSSSTKAMDACQEAFYRVALNLYKTNPVIQITSTVCSRLLWEELEAEAREWDPEPIDEACLSHDHSTKPLKYRTETMYTCSVVRDFFEDRDKRYEELELKDIPGEVETIVSAYAQSDLHCGYRKKRIARSFLYQYFLTPSMKDLLQALQKSKTSQVGKYRLLSIDELLRITDKAASLNSSNGRG